MPPVDRAPQPVQHTLVAEFRLQPIPAQARRTQIQAAIRKRPVEPFGSGRNHPVANGDSKGQTQYKIRQEYTGDAGSRASGTISAMPCRLRRRYPGAYGDDGGGGHGRLAFLARLGDVLVLVAPFAARRPALRRLRLTVSRFSSSTACLLSLAPNVRFRHGEVDFAASSYIFSATKCSAPPTQPLTAWREASFAGARARDEPSPPALLPSSNSTWL